MSVNRIKCYVNLTLLVMLLNTEMYIPTMRYQTYKRDQMCFKVDLKVFHMHIVVIRF